MFNVTTLARGWYTGEKSPGLTHRDLETGCVYIKKRSTAYLCTASSFTNHKPQMCRDHKLLLSNRRKCSLPGLSENSYKMWEVTEKSPRLDMAEIMSSGADVSCLEQS